MKQSSRLLSRILISCISITAFALPSSWSADLLATVAPSKEPKLAPLNKKFLGPNSYISVTTQKLAKPTLVYVDIAQDRLTTADNKFLLDKWGWAVPTSNEPIDAYTQAFRIHNASFYGGNGMNGNIGDGRASIYGDENFKGIGPTGMVNAHTEVGHTSGTLKIDHAIIESIWSKLLDLELPYGANRVRGIVGTGTIEDRDGHPGPRVIIVRDDFLRPAHFITNETSAKVGRSEADHERVRRAILNLPEALPQSPLFAQSQQVNRVTKLKLGLKEFIERFAIQTAYMWSHSLYHGAMSPSNLTLQGAAADFGTFQALGGYVSVQLLIDCAPNGDFSEELQVLREFHTELSNNSPIEWSSAIGSLYDWTEHFKKTYQLTVEKEMLSLSGAFLELIDPLADTFEAHRLATTLIKIAKAGNEDILQTWKRPLSFETGTYNLPHILEAMAKASLNEDEIQISLQPEIQDKDLRDQLATFYVDYFKKMNALAAHHEISSQAAQIYRIKAVEIRNRKMTEMYRTKELQEQLNAVIKDYSKVGDTSIVRQFIEQKVNASRRNFKDAEPFTIVSQQSINEKTGLIARQVYNAKTGQSSDFAFAETTPLANILEAETLHQRGLICEALFIAN